MHDRLSPRGWGEFGRDGGAGLRLSLAMGPDVVPARWRLRRKSASLRRAARALRQGAHRVGSQATLGADRVRLVERGHRALDHPGAAAARRRAGPVPSERGTLVSPAALSARFRRYRDELGQDKGTGPALLPP